MRSPETAEPYEPDPYPRHPESSRPGGTHGGDGTQDPLADLKSFISSQQNDLAKQRLTLINQEKHLHKIVRSDDHPEEAGAASDLPRGPNRADASGSKRRGGGGGGNGRHRNVMINTGKMALGSSSVRPFG